MATQKKLQLTTYCHLKCWYFTEVFVNIGKLVILEGNQINQLEVGQRRTILWKSVHHAHYQLQACSCTISSFSFTMKVIRQHVN